VYLVLLETLIKIHSTIEKVSLHLKATGNKLDEIRSNKIQQKNKSLS